MRFLSASLAALVIGMVAISCGVASAPGQSPGNLTAKPTTTSVNVTLSPGSGNVKLPAENGLERVYVQLKDRCRKVLGDNSLRGGSSTKPGWKRVQLYTLLTKCVDPQASAVIFRIGPFVRVRTLLLSSALIVDATPIQISQLKADADVEFVASSTPVYVPEGAAFDIGENCPTPTVSTWDEGGVSIGIMDSGFAWGHQSVRGHYRGLKPNSPVDLQHNWHDALSGKAEACYPPEPCDIRGDYHGTGVAGVISSETPNGESITFFGCRDVGSGKGTDLGLHECLEYLFAPSAQPPSGERDPFWGADIINASQGGCDPQPLTACKEINESLEKLSRGGVLVVAASGTTSNGGEINSMPAMSQYAWTVGGIKDGKVTSYSPKGPNTTPCKPDFVASDPIDKIAFEPTRSCGERVGPSFDAPRVSVLVARLWLEFPLLRAQIAPTLKLLTKIATKPPSPSNPCPPTSPNDPPLVVPNREFGWGEISFDKAVKQGIEENMPRRRPRPPP